MVAYLYRIEDVDRLLEAKEPVLRLNRHFGPPRDYPHAMLETVRKQLPMTRAVYKLEGFRQPPRLPATTGLDRPSALVLRIATRGATFLGLTGLPDERLLANGQIYFGIDDATTGSSQISPNLSIPFVDIEAWVGNRWCGLTRGLLEGRAGCDASLAAARAATTPSASDANQWAMGIVGLVCRTS